MNQFVRCPGCAAIYKVVPDQLKIGKGWLRCGQCQRAFDSTGLVLTWSSPVAELPDVLAPVAGVERLVIDDFLKQEDQSTRAEPETDKGRVPAAVISFESALSSFESPTFASVNVKDVPISSHISEASTFKSSVPTKQVVLKTRLTWPIKFCAAVLSLSLAVQWLWIERQMLAASEPVFAKALHFFCRTLGCDVLPLQVSGGIVIESSGLLKQDDGFQLSWTLRNATAQPLLMPALELTLLNSQDKAVVRRVLRVTETGAPQLLTPNQSWTDRLNIFPHEGVEPSGYRVIGFYP